MVGVGSARWGRRAAPPAAAAAGSAAPRAPPAAHPVAPLLQRFDLLRLERGHAHALDAVPKLAAAARAGAGLVGAATQLCHGSRQGRRSQQAAAGAAAAGASAVAARHSLDAAAHRADEHVELADHILRALQRTTSQRGSG